MNIWQDYPDQTDRVLKELEILPTIQSNPKFGNAASFTAFYCLALTINWQEPHFLWHPVGEFCFPVRHRTCSCHRNRKFNAASPRPFKNTESTVVVHQQKTARAGTMSSVRKATKLPGFISVILLPVSSCWCKFLRYETRNFSKCTRKLLNHLQTGSDCCSLQSSSNLQKLINMRPRDCMWSTKLLDFKHKVLKDFWETNLYQIFTEGTFGKNNKCSIFYLYLF